MHNVHSIDYMTEEKMREMQVRLDDLSKHCLINTALKALMLVWFQLSLTMIKQKRKKNKKDQTREKEKRKSKEIN